MDYWDKKEERKIIARNHTEEMAKNYSQEIYASIRDTIVYGTPDRLPFSKKEGRKPPNIILQQTDSVSGAIQHQQGKTAILNFASYKNPGGMFFNGSSAQEESLCHSSFLYNVLRTFDKTYYEWNRKHLNRALYTDRALYSPNILFFDQLRQCYFDVITCAAPNYGAAAKWQHVTAEENRAFLTNRIKFIAEIAEENKVETLVLGAYGCGVFKQDPSVVAKVFHEVFREATIRNLIFPIPDKKNLAPFQKEF